VQNKMAKKTLIQYLQNLIAKSGLIIIFSFFCAISILCAQNVRVGLFSTDKTIKVELNDSCELTSGPSNKKMPAGVYDVSLKGQKIVFGEYSFEKSILLKTLNNSQTIGINSKDYTGTMLFKVTDNKILLINELEIDEYLKGVLPKEMGKGWPIEALKAQAVISRTYALRNLGSFSKKGYDLSADVGSQVYGGKSAHTPESDQAVNETANEVLTFNGKLADTFFHADSGGYTENISNVWSSVKNPPNYLKGKPDKFSKKGGSYKVWETKISKDELENKLNSSGYKVGTIEKIKVEGKNSSGRALNIKIYHSNGILLIQGSKFRMAVSPWQIKSTLIDEIVRMDDAFEFRGKGWGHGVGLSQDGAKVMAKENYNYREILHFYYPGTNLEKRK